MLTVLAADSRHEVEGRMLDGAAFVDRAVVPSVLGWTLEPRGLCRGDVCVPVREAELLHGSELDLVATAEILGCPTLTDPEEGIVAIGVAGERRRGALTGREAPDFTLPDLAGAPHSLEEFAGRKRLLLAFASW